MSSVISPSNHQVESEAGEVEAKDDQVFLMTQQVMRLFFSDYLIIAPLSIGAH